MRCSSSGQPADVLPVGRHAGEAALPGVGGLYAALGSVWNRGAAQRWQCDGLGRLYCHVLMVVRRSRGLDCCSSAICKQQA